MCSSDLAETGHLCLATLHSNNADQTIERILNFFPESAHKNVLMNLALNLRAVVSQRLVKGVDGRRLPAAEVLINTPMIRDLLRRGQVHEIKAAMEESLEEGMESFDQCLFRMVKEGLISKADDPSHKQKALYSLTEMGIALVPVFAMMAPPTMKPMLAMPNSTPHTSTETSSRP